MSEKENNTMEEQENPSRFGTIAEVSGFGPFPTLLHVLIEEDETGELVSITVPNQQSCHPIGELADVVRERLGLPTGQFTGPRVDVVGERVAFIECADEFGFVGSLMARETYDELIEELKEAENAKV